MNTDITTKVQVVFLSAPYLDSHSSLTLAKLLLIWADIANNLTTGQIYRNCGVRQRTVTKILHMVANAALHEQDTTEFNFSKLQVNELLSASVCIIGANAFARLGGGL